jgi:hypothetical protein
MAPKTNVVTFRLDGEDHPVDLYDIDGVEWRDAKRASGYRTQVALLDAALVDKEFDAVAAFLWIVDRRSDPSLEYLTVLRRFNYGVVVNGEAEPSTTKPPD